MRDPDAGYDQLFEEGRRHDKWPDLYDVVTDNPIQGREIGAPSEKAKHPSPRE